MYFSHDGLVKHALQYFQAAPFTTPADGNTFFEIFGAGNVLQLADRPFERLSDYEELLRRTKLEDGQKYRKIHKGTPFYYMSWLSFDLRNYQKALFYIDTAISEDVRNDPVGWKGSPGARFLILDPADQAAQRTVVVIKQALEAELTRFNAVSNRPHLTMESWRAFVSNLLVDPTQRTLISALYVFMLEFADHFQELSLREGSTVGGSNQPFTVHLFTGGLLFESLLKRCYPFGDSGQPNRTLRNCLKTTAFLRDFDLAAAPEGSAYALEDIYAATQGSTSVETAFATAAKLRNTTGHNLVWDNIFDAADKYVALFQQVMNAVLFVIARKFV